MRQRRGFALVATTLFAAVLVAFVGLAIDVGYLQWQKLLLRLHYSPEKSMMHLCRNYQQQRHKLLLP